GQGSNIPSGVPYTEDEIMAIVHGGTFPVLVGFFRDRARSDDKFSQMLTQLESEPEYGVSGRSDGCGDDEPGDVENGGEDGEDEDDCLGSDGDTVQLETAVNTISHEYLLDFTSEYGIPETLHPALPGPEDRIVDFPEDMDLFNLIRAPNPTKVKTGSHPRAPHEVPLLILTAPRVIEMDEPAATDSSGVPSTIERSPLDFAHEAGALDQGAAALEMPSSEDVPATAAPGAGQAEEAAMMDPPTAPESRKRGRDGTDGKSLAAIQLGLASTVVPEDAPVGVSDPDPLSFADASSRDSLTLPSIAAAGDSESENASSPAEVGSPGSGNGITAALEIRAGGKAAEEVRGSGGSPG
nr:hypothetical protein [Tanacetum cinerariifolium]